MKDTRWRTWEIIGLFWTLAAGNLLHFVYDWTGSSVAAALFSAVNESTWEHMKLLAVPWILFSLVEYIVLRSGGIAGPRAVGLLVGLAAIPLLFYGYKGVVGQGNMIVDILIFQVSVLLSFWVSWSLQKRRRLSGAGWTVLGLLVLLGVVLWMGRRKLGAFARAAEEAPRKAKLPSRESLNDWAVKGRLWRLLHKDGRQGPRGNDCMSWENPDGPAESARAPQ